MRLNIRTLVNAPLDQVKEGFTQELFLSLNPPFPTVELLQFDGCKKGDKVALELNFLLFKQVWQSDIVFDELKDDSWLFVDKGVKLPFFLKTWTHNHRVESLSSNTSEIIDDIEYTTGTWLSDLIMYPAMLGQFIYRKPIYKRLFNKKASE